MKATTQVLVNAANAGVLESPDITYMSLNLVQEGEGTFSTYNVALKAIERLKCDEVRRALTAWMYQEEVG